MSMAAGAAPATRGLDASTLRKFEAVLMPAGTLVASAWVFSVFLLTLGKSPLQFYGLIRTGGFGSAFSVQNTLLRSAPLILTGLAFAIPARIGLTVIGAEGALVLGGFVAAVVAIPLVTVGWTPLIGLPLMAAAAMAAAAGGWIGFVGWLRHYRGVNETIA